MVDSLANMDKGLTDHQLRIFTFGDCVTLGDGIYALNLHFSVCKMELLSWLSHRTVMRTAMSLRSVADFPSEGMHLLLIKNIDSLRPCLCSNLNTHFNHSYGPMKSYPPRYVDDGFLLCLTSLRPHPENTLATRGCGLKLVTSLGREATCSPWDFLNTVCPHRL